MKQKNTNVPTGLTIHTYLIEYPSNKLNLKNKAILNLYKTMEKKLGIHPSLYNHQKVRVLGQGEIARSFNNAFPTGTFKKGDILFINQLGDISLSMRDAVKKLERFSSEITIYVCSISINKDYSFYRESLLAFYGLSEDDCQKKAGGKTRRKKAISQNVRAAYAHYYSLENTASISYYVDKLQLSRSHLYRLFKRIREGE